MGEDTRNATQSDVTRARRDSWPRLSGSRRAANAQDKFPFRLNWTLYGEHAPFFVARDKGFYKEEGLDVEILEGSGSTTVAQLVANQTNPVAYVDAATMMRGVGAGMPIKAVGVTLQQSPMSFIYRADNPRADQDRRNQRQPHRDHRGRRQPRHLHRLHGQAEHAVRTCS